MAAPVWIAASRSASPTPSNMSSRTSRSSASASTSASNGSFAYVPPNLRRARNIGRVELELARMDNELGEQHREAAKHTGPKLPHFKLPYCLDKTQLAFLTSRFPRTQFKCTSDNTHDHPLAHAETMIAFEKAKRMVPAGHRIIDMFGSPSGCEDFNRSQLRSNNPKSMFPYVAIKTEKDYLRALKWGDQTDAEGNLRYAEGAGDLMEEFLPTSEGLDQRFGVGDSTKLTYLFKHTLYYLSDDEIAGLLRPTGSRAFAIVHRHASDNGVMFNGECTYGKVSGTVEQVNSLTGERYVHRDLSWLWDSKSKVVRTPSGGFVWTFHMITADTWVIELTGCSVRLDERLKSRSAACGEKAAMAEIAEHDLAPSLFPHPSLATLPGAKCVMLSGVPLVSFEKWDLPPVRLTCPPLYDFLFTSQVGKPRDTERLCDLFSLARSHISNGSEFPGKRNFNVAPSDIAGHVCLAFIGGLGHESDLLKSMEAFRTVAKEHKALLDGSAIVVPSGVHHPESSLRSTVSVLKRVNEARKKNDTFSAILDLVD